MFLPDPNNNIYPKTKKNLTHLLSFYFDEFDLEKNNEVEFLLSFTSLRLNQIEFISKKLSECWVSIFLPFFGPNKTTLKNLLRHGIDGLTKEEIEWSFGRHSRSRPVIKEFIHFVEETEK